MSKETLSRVLNQVEGIVEGAEREVDTVFKPVRETVFSRFPILFLLLVTFGITSTILGFERLIAQVQLLNDHPLLMIGAGVFTLVVTGTLYKKLG